MRAIRDQRNGAFCIRLEESESDDSESLAYLLAQATKEMEKDSTLSVQIDFNLLIKLSSTFVQQLAKSGLAIKQLNRKIGAIGVTDILKRKFQVQGIEGLFDFTQKRAGSIALDVKVINPFIQGAIETFEVQCGTPVVAGGIQLKREFQYKYPVDIMAIIGLRSAAFAGSIALCFPEKTFLNIMEKMLGEPCPAVTPEIRDGAGELLNIMFGIAKTKLNENGLQIEKAIPSVIAGKEIQISYISSELAIELPFTSAAGPFHIEIGHDSGD